jgi:LacI family transcriptional regulator
MNKRPTLADVARAAGVSKTTASLALNGKRVEKIPATTRDRVLAAAGALQFRPHGVARALVHRRADVLGVVCTLNPFVEMSHHAFEQALLSAVFYHSLEHGYNPMIYGVPAESTEVTGFMRYADGRSDAFILLYPPPESSLLAFLHACDIPAVALCCRDPNGYSRWVDSDNEAGIRAALEHLIELGHRRIAYFIGPEVEDNVHSRVTAFRATLRENGLAVREDWIVPYTWDSATTEQTLDRLLRSDPAPTALLTWNDFVAEEVYKALRQLDRRVPEDISIVGFDDMPSARTAIPPLTTVRQDVVRMGRASVELALQAFREPESTEEIRHIVCPISLVVRQSTAPPAS